MDCENYIGMKITVPQVLQKVLPRPGIAKIIDSAPMDQMIYMVAPFGCGKTMAAISWLEDHGQDAAWVSYDKGDNSEISFWGLITAAILRFAGEWEKAEIIMSDPNFIGNPQGFLTNTLIRISPPIGNRVLVIDNFTCIQENELLYSLKALINEMLGCWRIIAIGRCELPPIFNDFLLKKKLCLISLQELAFSEKEVDEYFLMNGYTVNRSDITQLREETDGWPAALNAVLAVPQNGPIRYNDLAKEYVAGYFELEIWEQIDDRIKSLLIKTSVLDQLTPSLCYYVADVDETNLILRNLYVNGVFISKLDGSEIYCYHRVFRDFLLAKLKTSGIDIDSLYVKAGWWLYEQGESIQSLLCFYKAGYIYGINQAFKKVKPADLGMEKYLDAVSCLTSLDIMDLKGFPEVAVRIALIHFIKDNIEEAKRIYNVVSGWVEPGLLTIPPEEYVDFTWEIGWLRYINPDVDILFDKKFEEWINITEYAPHLIESDRSRASALRLPSVLRGFRDFSAVTDQAEEYYKRNMDAKHRVVRDKDCLFIMDLIIAEISYEREDFNKAEKIIKELMPALEKEKMTELYFVCTVLLVKISRAAHNSNEIDMLTVRLRALIESNGHFFLLPNFHAYELRNRLAEGVPGATGIFMEENTPYINKPYYYLIYRHITFARSLLSEAKYREASLILGNLDLLCRQYKRNMDLIEVNILCSIAEYGLEHREGAYQHLMEALALGRNSGFIRIFSDDAVNLWPILSLVRKRDMNAYTKRISASCKRELSRTGIVTRINRNTYEQLTNKEIEILKLLQSGMSNQEIALAKNISSGTVKTHLHSIYSKLAVDGRATAVVVADKLGIIRSRE